LACNGEKNDHRSTLSKKEKQMSYGGKNDRRRGKERDTFSSMKEPGFRKGRGGKIFIGEGEKEKEGRISREWKGRKKKKRSGKEEVNGKEDK